MLTAPTCVLSSYFKTTHQVKGDGKSFPARIPPGVVVSVEVVDSQPPTAIEQLEQDQCQVVGRVVQISKRQNRILLKVTRPDEKTLKLTMSHPDPQMEISELWSCTAIRVGSTLQIIEANPLEEIYQSPTTTPASQTPLSTAINQLNRVEQPGLSDLGPPTEEALEALKKETGVASWELSTQRQREQVWEWEALNPGRGLRARVKVSESPHRMASVYQYPTAPESASHKTPIPSADDRLVVTPLGGALGIEANCFRVEMGPYEIVLDCGTRTTGHSPLPALEYLKHPELLLLSHAHTAHIGAVPVFHSRWNSARMFCTPGTRELAHVMLLSGLKSKLSTQDSNALFEQSDLEQTLFRLETYPFNQDFEPLPGLKIRFINAGHVVGAACIYLRYGSRSLLYTGNYNTTSSRTTDGLRLKDLPQADILLTEGTCGANTNPARKQLETELLNEIAAVVQAGGNVLIPVFPLGRAQDILLAMRTSPLFKPQKIPIYVDEMVGAVTDVLGSNLDLLPTSVQNLAKQLGMKPFFNQNANPPIIRLTIAPSHPLTSQKPSVIIADSDLFADHTSPIYASTLLESDSAAIFISGDLDVESLLGALHHLKTGDKIELDGIDVTVRAQIKRFNLSTHADKIGLTQVINTVNPKHLILIHGDKQNLQALARSGDLCSKHYIHIPSVGDHIAFGTPPLSANRKQILSIEAVQEFEVEVSAEYEGAWIRIPESVVDLDPRWQMLAGNGVLKAKWEGIHLKLSPTDNQNMAIESARASGIDCCAKCQDFSPNTSQCNSPDSPLSGLSVDPSGYCLEYIMRKDN